MPRTFFTLLIVSYMLVPAQSFSLTKRKKTPPKKVVFEIKKEPKSKIKINTQFGLNIISGSAVISGFQVGRRIAETKDIFAGPEINFMMYSSGSILNILLGGWIENHFFSDQRKTIDIGISAGAAFAHERLGLKTANFAGMLDVAYAQEVDEKLIVRGQIRSGYIGSTFLGQLNFNAQFRFP